MTPTVGFVLLTHNKPHQTIRLIGTLNRMFDEPPIVCHHDFSKSEFPKDTLPKNVSLVLPYLETGWAKFSVVEAMLQALQLMYKDKLSPDWFILLSGSDYPIKPAKQILHDLEESSYDAHISHRLISYKNYPTKWEEECYKRYFSIKIPLPLSRRHINITHPSLAGRFVPFSEDFRCYAGEHWFCANRKAAEYLIEFHNTKPALASYYRKLDRYHISPDESYYQTIFCNAPHLKVYNNHWRYIDWSAKKFHPKTLMLEDLLKLQASSAHFARKFDIDVDGRILDELDAIIG